MNYYLGVFKKYAVFSGRARRREYWDFVLFNILILIVLTLIDVNIIKIYTTQAIGILSGLFLLIIIIPSLAVAIRRLHDINRSGWWIIFDLVPLVGPIVLFIFSVLDSTPGDNKYGPNPKEINTK